MTPGRLDPRGMPARIAVVGAGVMGAGIAQVAVEAGHEVVLHDLDHEQLGRATGRVRDGLARRARRRGMSDAAQGAWVADALGRLVATDDLAGCAGAGLVIEAIVEQLEPKLRLLRALDRIVDEATLTSNSSALSIATLASAVAEPGRVAGLHFFNPAPLMPLVEVVSAPTTDPRRADALVALMGRWGKTPIGCVDAPGFIVNRVNRPFTLEALAMLQAAVAPADVIDGAVRAAGYPQGPFELMDMIGLDVNLAAARAIHAAFVARGDPDAERFRPSTTQERLVAEGRLGRKTGEGFYRYAEAPPASPPAPAPGPPLADEIVSRIELAVIAEALRALAEGIADAASIDLALRLGAGHPRGPFERMAELGGEDAVRTRLAMRAAEGPRFSLPPDAVRSR